MSPSAGEQYDVRFYQDQVDGSRAATDSMLGLTSRLVGLRDVLDVGCGTGVWLNVAEALGARHTLELDGPHVPVSARLLPAGHFIEHDLRQPFALGRRFGLVICLEVAEHLPIETAPALVACLVQHGVSVLFSAALPYQGGTSHIAETWPEFWVELFAAHCHRGVDALRPELWRDHRIPWWYRQTAVLFVSPRRYRSAPRLWRHPAPVSIVHPASYLWANHRPRSVLGSFYNHDIYVY